jgi:hypothetical protein
MPRIRSGFSFHCAYGHLKNIAARLDDIGYEKQPLTDRLSTFGFAAWQKLVPNPIYGVELPVSNDMTGRRPVTANWTFLATTLDHD